MCRFHISNENRGDVLQNVGAGDKEIAFVFDCYEDLFVTVVHGYAEGCDKGSDRLLDLVRELRASPPQIGNGFLGDVFAQSHYPQSLANRFIEFVLLAIPSWGHANVPASSIQGENYRKRR